MGRSVEGEKVETVIQLVEGSFGGIVMSGCGILAVIVVGFWWPITAFLHNWWWGALTLVFPPTFFVFACLHFQKAKAPLLLGILVTLVSVGLFIARSFLATFFNSGSVMNLT